jgi:hypothetical protein
VKNKSDTAVEGCDQGVAGSGKKDDRRPEDVEQDEVKC